jgi:hypothetical protein
MLFILFFFSRASLVELGRFGSVQSISDFKNRNRTEPEIFCDFLISLIDFFYGSVFSVIFFSVFSIFSIFWFFCSPLYESKKNGTGALYERERERERLLGKRVYLVSTFWHGHYSS